MLVDFPETALGALAIGNAIAWRCSCLLLGIPFALDPLISQCVGACETDRAYDWFEGMFGRLHYNPTHRYRVDPCCTYTLRNRSGAGRQRMELSHLQSPIALFFQLFLTGRAYLQAHGVTRPILMAAVAANGVNLILDLLFVFGDRSLEAVGLPSVGLPAMGEAGAGLTTTFSTLCLCLYVHANVRCHRPPQKMSKAAPIRKRTILILAWPISLQQVGESWLFCVFGILTGSLDRCLIVVAHGMTNPNSGRTRNSQSKHEGGGG